PKPQAVVDSKPSVSEVAASPAAAPTPKPTSAVTSSATTSTSASQWSGQMSETSTVSSSSAINVQARSWYGKHFFCNQLYHHKSQGILQPSLVAEWGGAVVAKRKY
ncbi:hypothetical protein KCU73_g15447, partial [Aureobasidium melanogenum]